MRKKILETLGTLICILSFFWIAGIGGGLEEDTLTIKAAVIELMIAFPLMVAGYQLAKRGSSCR